MAQKQPNQPNKKQALASVDALGIDLANTMGKAMERTLANFDFGKALGAGLEKTIQKLVDNAQKGANKIKQQFDSSFNQKIVQNNFLEEFLHLEQEANKDKYLLEQQINALQNERIAELSDQFAVQAQLLDLAEQLTDQKINELKQEQATFQTLERKKDLLLDVKQAQQEYNQALKQAKADIDIKEITIRLGLTEQEVSQKARLIAEQNKQKTGSADLTAEQIKQLKNEDEALRHKREVVESVEHQANWIRELNEEVEEYGKGWEKLKSKVSAVITSKEVRNSFLSAYGFERIHEGMHETIELFGEMRKEGLTISQATTEVGIALGSTFSLSGASMKENAEIMAGLREEMGNMDGITRNTVVEVGKMAKTFGISATEAGKLQGAFQMMPGATAESATDTLEFAGNLAKAAHVAPGDVMKAMASSAEDVAAYSKDGGKNIAVAAVAAKKLGLEFSTISKMSESILNFENSIEKQMEASVLLGREINLDKARELALNGDLVGATREMLANVGGEAEFNKMNVLQRKALADSMGVSVAELSKMVKNQDKLNDLTQEQQMALASGEVTMDEVLANAGGVASRLRDWGAGTFAFLKNISLFKNTLKDSVGLLKEGWSAAKGMFGAFSSAKKEGAGFFSSLKEGVGALKKFAGFGSVGVPKQEEVAKMIPSGKAATTKLSETVGEAAKKEPKLTAGKGVKDFLTNLAEGLKAMGNTKVLFGAVNLIPASAGLTAMIAGTAGAFAIQLINGEKVSKNLIELSVGLQAMSTTFVGSLALGAFGAAALLAIPSLIFLGGIALLGAPAGTGLTALGVGLSAFGATAPVAIIGIGLIAALGLAMIPFAAALYIATPAIEAFGNIIIGVLKEVPPIIESIANSFVTMLSAISLDKILPLALLPPILIGFGTGLAVLGASALIAAPGLFVLTTALSVLSPAVSQISLSLALLSENSEGLASMGISLFSIAGGLGAIALAGLAALPVLGALTALSTVAPGLAGAVLGGAGGGTEQPESSSLEAKLDVLIEEIRGLKEVAATGGEVRIDGQKIGTVISPFLDQKAFRATINSRNIQ